MTEAEVRTIAEEYVTDQALDPCRIVSVKRFNRCDIPYPSTIGDEWVVQFQFNLEEGASAHYALVVVDDATGIPEIVESL